MKATQLIQAAILGFWLIGQTGMDIPEVKGAETRIELEKFFVPPQDYRDRLGDYRSLMRFEDGTLVKTRQDWSQRRKEILDYWHDVMGPWPPLLGKPRIKYLEKERIENFTRHKVQVEFAPDRFASTQYLLLPEGKGPFPAVLITWYNSADSAGLTEKGRGSVDFGYQLAKRGFVTLCIGGEASVISAKNTGPSGRKNEIQPLSRLAYAAANCCNALARMPEVDSQRIGVVGHSFGGKWAMFASCLHDKFACAVWVDPGIVWNEKDPNANYWEKWYLGYEFGRPADQQRKPGVPHEGNLRTGAYKRLVAEGRDLHELHALMAPRPFLVSGGAQDRPEHWTALNHSIALNQFLGQPGRIAMTMREGHTPTRRSNAQVWAFFEHFLKP
jgi:dienelactone hydrolase